MEDDIQFIGMNSCPYKGAGSDIDSHRRLIGVKLVVGPDGDNPPTTKVFYKQWTNVVHVGRMPSTEGNTSTFILDRATFTCPVISRKHAKITFSQGGRRVEITDTHSHHGTHILKAGETASTPLKPDVPCTLVDGDVVTFGKSVQKDGRTVRPVTVRIEMIYPNGYARSNADVAPPTIDLTEPTPEPDNTAAPIPRPPVTRPVTPEVTGRYGLFSHASISSSGESDSEDGSWDVDYSRTSEGDVGEDQILHSLPVPPVPGPPEVAASHRSVDWHQSHSHGGLFHGGHSHGGYSHVFSHVNMNPFGLGIGSGTLPSLHRLGLLARAYESSSQLNPASATPASSAPPVLSSNEKESGKETTAESVPVRQNRLEPGSRASSPMDLSNGSPSPSVVRLPPAQENTEEPSVKLVGSWPESCPEHEPESDQIFRGYSPVSPVFGSPQLDWSSPLPSRSPAFSPPSTSLPFHRSITRVNSTTEAGADGRSLSPPSEADWSSPFSPISTKFGPLDDFDTPQLEDAGRNGLGIRPPVIGSSEVSNVGSTALKDKKLDPPQEKMESHINEGVSDYSADGDGLRSEQGEDEVGHVTREEMEEVWASVRVVRADLAKLEIHRRKSKLRLMLHGKKVDDRFVRITERLDAMQERQEALSDRLNERIASLAGSIPRLEARHIMRPEPAVSETDSANAQVAATLVEETKALLQASEKEVRAELEAILAIRTDASAQRAPIPSLPSTLTLPPLAVTPIQTVSVDTSSRSLKRKRSASYDTHDRGEPDDIVATEDQVPSAKRPRTTTRSAVAGAFLAFGAVSVGAVAAWTALAFCP